VTVFADQPMPKKISLGDTALRVGIAPLFQNPPSFTRELPSPVRSQVGVEAFQLFIVALEGTVPVVMTGACTTIPYIWLFRSLFSFYRFHFGALNWGR
jgi:hypothetical protein